jgi:hypothetical protein
MGFHVGRVLQFTFEANIDRSAYGDMPYRELKMRYELITLLQLPIIKRAAIYRKVVIHTICGENLIPKEVDNVCV